MCHSQLISKIIIRGVSKRAGREVTILFLGPAMAAGPQSTVTPSTWSQGGVLGAQSMLFLRIHLDVNLQTEP